MREASLNGKGVYILKARLTLKRGNQTKLGGLVRGTPLYMLPMRSVHTVTRLLLIAGAGARPPNSDGRFGLKCPTLVICGNIYGYKISRHIFCM